MKLKERFTKSSIILLAVGSLLPLCVLGMDIILLLANTLFTPGYMIIQGKDEELQVHPSTVKGGI